MTLKSLQIINKLKQSYLASKLCVTTACVSQWTKGKRQPPIDQLPKLADVLNCSIEELVLALIETKNIGDKK